MGSNIVLISSEASEVGGGADPDYAYTFTLGENGEGDTATFELAGGGEAVSYTFAGLDATELTYIDFTVGDNADGSAAVGGVNDTGDFSFTVDLKQLVADGITEFVIDFTVTGLDPGAIFTDTDSVTITLQICVARGTGVLTPDGYRPVEEIGVGDPITLADGRTEPVRWISSRHLGPSALQAEPHLRPVLIRKDAIAHGIPRRDLRVSPQHRIALDDWRAELFFGEARVLAPAKGLVNDATIVVDGDAQEVEYFHLLFDAHEVILTDGLPTESFHPGDYSLATLDGKTRRELLELFPDLLTGETPDAVLPGVRPWEARVLTPADGPSG